MLEFEIKGKIKAKQSFKIGRNGFKYTPADVVNYANYVKLCFLQKYPKWQASILQDDALWLVIDVYFAVPKSFSKKKRQQALEGEIYPTVKPDCDNCCKCLADSLNGLAYPDDKQIVKLSVNKFYAEADSVKIKIFPIVQKQNIQSKHAGTCNNMP